MNGADEPLDELVAFAAQHAEAPVASVARVLGGGNNRLYRVQTARGSLALKAYFHHASETRDRMRSEFDFVEFCWRRGLRWTPKPLACDRTRRWALYEFVAGEKRQAGQVTEADVAQAMQFFTSLNAQRDHAEASPLPLAAEACFSLSDHLACVQRRLDRLARVEPQAAIDAEAARFVSKHLQQTWQETVERVQVDAAAEGFALDERIACRDRCLSPSDFGFHNALAQPDGRLRFLDFEYAGWDDPAKLVCDFFCQVEVPVPLSTWDRVARAAAATVRDERRHAARFRLLLPVYRIKWCCIVLNDFLPLDNERRRFAVCGDPGERKHRQLAKARAALELVAA